MTVTRARSSFAALRSRAEEMLRTTQLEVATLPAEDVQRLVHELQVHQVELEMQNEELRARTRELEETRSQYQDLFELAPTAYLDLDSSGVIRQANLAAATLLESNRGELTGKPFAEFVDSKDELVLHEHLRSTSRHVPSTCELCLSKLPARPWVLLLASCDAAPTAGYSIALVDVTDRRAAQEALRQLNQELEGRVVSRTAELAEQNGRLEEEILAQARGEEERRRLEAKLRGAERLKSLGLLAGGIAHDFNNLLVGILGTADLLLQKRVLPPDVRESLALIRRGARGASDLTRQMLIYAGESQVRLGPVDLHRAIRDGLELLSFVPESVELLAELAGESPSIEADRGQVQQVVTNLVTNAIEALVDDNGSVGVRTRVSELDGCALARYAHATGAEPGRFAILTVTDTGRGMDATMLSRVFDPFFTTKFTGRGLGLASVLGIVQGHRGAVRVRSEPGRGTVFEIAWPLSSQAAPATVSSIPVTEWRGAGRVLVVDDDEFVRTAIARQLAFLGFEVFQAPSGAEGLRMVREAASPFALVLLDRTMPGLSGDEVLALLGEEAPGLPVVLMSGWSADALALPREDVTFLQKPMTVSELQSAVRTLLELKR